MVQHVEYVSEEWPSYWDDLTTVAKETEKAFQGIAGHVVGMGVAAEKDLDVRELEAEFFDGRADDRDGFFVVAVDQDVAFGSRDQKRAKLFGPDEVHVADDLVGRERLVPVDSRKGIGCPAALPRLS